MSPKNQAKIRAIAVAAPEAIAGIKGEAALSSSDPVSLFNACRVAAEQARGKKGAWAQSNWVVDSRMKLSEKFLLLHSLDDLWKLRELLVTERPNILFIGAMTLCLPGAIACAKVAKELLGSDILVVLGGRHVSETMYIPQGQRRTKDNVSHHNGSPSKLISEGKIPEVFDIIVSGDGEYLIAEIGRIIHDCNGNFENLILSKELDVDTPGDWIASFPRLKHFVVGQRTFMARDSLPGLAPLFGVSAAFSIFNGRKTAHIFSDIGRGCVYDCDFCSERSSINGGVFEISGAPKRLHQRLREAHDVISEDSPDVGSSAFVEDSVFLGGSPKLLNDFCDLLERDPLDILFGVQLTIDKLIGSEEQLERLSQLGMSYIFVGLETLKPEEIGGISKDLSRSGASWMSRFNESIQICKRNSIGLGCAVLFGLGEKQESRVELLKLLIEARSRFGLPVIVSANWAVQHPLQGRDQGANHEYLAWGTPKGPYLDIFQNFGEASINYPIQGVEVPSLKELREIAVLMNEF